MIDSKQEFSREEIEKGKIYAMLSYIPFLCFIPLLSGDIKNRFAIKHSKQGLLLLFFEVIALFFLVDIFSKVFWIAVLVLCLLLALIGVVNALIGRSWTIPYLGNIFEKYDI